MAKRTDLTPTNTTETIVAPGVAIKGNLTIEGDISFDGQLTGNLKSGGNIIIGVNAVIKGDIIGVNVLIAGRVFGPSKANGETVVSETGRIEGDIHTTTLSVANGAIINGRIVMASSEASA